MGDARLECSIYMAPGANTTYVRFALSRARGPLELELLPLTTWRDYHSHQHVGPEPSVHTDGHACVIEHEPTRLQLHADGMTFELGGGWHLGVKHSEEAARGLDDGVDLYYPGRFTATLTTGSSVTLVASTEAGAQPSPLAVLETIHRRDAGLIARTPSGWPDWMRGLSLSADQFIVRRGAERVVGRGSTVIAGYPWFADWGRDTMISLPGLTLTTGRPEVAREILLTFAGFVRDGLLPNHFPDGDEVPETGVWE